MAVTTLQLGRMDLSVLVSAASLLISLGVLTVYIFQYRQRSQQLAEQRRQIDNQEKQLAAQRTQLEQQERELEQQERELEQYQRELEELERQTELAELEHQAHLEVEDYEFRGDRIVVSLSNYGNGPATDLRLRTTLDASGPEHICPKTAESRLRRCGDADGDVAPYEGQAIRPGEQRVAFEGESVVRLEGPTGETHQQSLRGVLLDLRSAGAAEGTTVTFDVLTETLTREELTVPVTDRALPVRLPEAGQPVTLQTALGPTPRF